jgi:hypothetical protein
VNESENIQSIAQQGPDLGDLLFLERAGAKRFNITNINGMFHHMLVIDAETEGKYLIMYANGKRNDDLFVQVPILQKKEEKMYFLDYHVGKDHIGWRVLN